MFLAGKSLDIRSYMVCTCTGGRPQIHKQGTEKPLTSQDARSELAEPERPLLLHTSGRRP